MRKLFLQKGQLTDRFFLSSEQTHHLVTVYRHNWKDPIQITDSKGASGFYLIKGLIDGRAQVELQVLEPIDSTGGQEHRLELVLVQSYLKADKFEWILQKACELDVAAIYGVATKNCVAVYKDKKLAAKEARWQRILVEASQQCGREKLPHLETTFSFTDALQVEKDKGALLLLAYENEDKQSLKKALQAYKGQRIVLCIGPEGGHIEEEVQQVQSLGGQSISLGRTILRAETAAIAGLSMINYEKRM